jgi:hypothetical protein
MSQILSDFLMCNFLFFFLCICTAEGPALPTELLGKACLQEKLFSCRTASNGLVRQILHLQCKYPFSNAMCKCVTLKKRPLRLLAICHGQNCILPRYLMQRFSNRYNAASALKVVTFFFVIWIEKWKKSLFLGVNVKTSLPCAPFFPHFSLRVHM